MLRQRQDQRLAVVGLRNGEGPCDKIHILPANPGLPLRRNPVKIIGQGNPPASRRGKRVLPRASAGPP